MFRQSPKSTTVSGRPPFATFLSGDDHEIQKAQYEDVARIGKKLIDSGVFENGTEIAVKLLRDFGLAVSYSTEENNLYVPVYQLSKTLEILRGFEKKADE